MAMGKKKIKQICSQFQGSKKKARKEAFLKREEERKMRKTRDMMLPVLSSVPRDLVVVPDRSMGVPILDAMINGVLPSVNYREFPQPEGPIVLPYLKQIIL